MKLSAVCAVCIPVVAIGSLILLPALSATKPAAPRSSASQGESQHIEVNPTELPDSDAPIEFTELQVALEQGVLTGEFEGNGRERMRIILTNTTETPLKVQADHGLVLKSGRDAVVVTRPCMIAVGAKRKAAMELQTAALRTGNRIGQRSWQISYDRVEKLEPFLAYLQSHPEVTPGAVQTAVLALTENLPVSAVAKFAPTVAPIKSRFNTDEFRVETIDIIGALAALREAEIDETSLALTIDPQLRIEAMIEPLCRATAMRYYGITPQTEWEYWKRELLQGDTSTRHYALYGIARFYPDIAMDMLPKWARENRTNPIYRLAAIQALVETQRPEAVTVLRQLTEDLGPTTELGRAAAGAAEYLDQRLAVTESRAASVAFRASRDFERVQ